MGICPIFGSKSENKSATNEEKENHSPKETERPLFKLKEEKKEP